MSDKNTTITIDLTAEERQQIENMADRHGYETAADFLRALERVFRADEELQHILETYPPEQVIARIEELNPDWKHDLLPWQVARPGEEIPWYAVYSLKRQSATPAALAWAKKRLAELKAGGDAS
jgi:hypothetical protein